MTDDVVIRLNHVSKHFGRVVAVDDVSLEIREGEFFSLLGPSGCGKTTTLRMLAGFEYPTSGSLILRGEDLTATPPNKRPMNMVFQAYELFPHMTVFENVAYGLKLKKVPAEEIQERVTSMLELVGVGGMENRSADQLSGGQQQRVALARALVNRPAVLLLDEPLSALDVKLRKLMQLELKSIQERLGTTFVYVTHDQEEALLMSDRIGIMNRGRLLQVGTPRDIYERPADPFVADFVGTLNDFRITIDRVEGDIAIMAFDESHQIRVAVPPSTEAGKTLRVAIRPEQVQIAIRDLATPTRMIGSITNTNYLGPTMQYVVDTPVGSILAQRVSDELTAEMHTGTKVTVGWADDSAFPLGTPQ